jgi:hypothetical protein
MITILIAKELFLIIMDTCDYKPGVTLDKWQNTTSCKKTPHGMYSHTKGCVSFTTAYMTT